MEGMPVRWYNRVVGLAAGSRSRLYGGAALALAIAEACPASPPPCPLHEAKLDTA
jgi:hypothetical protein